MRYFVILLVVGLLAACAAPQTVMLEHPKTGEVVQCGPFETLMEEAQCLGDYQSKGYERIDSQSQALITIRNSQD